MKKQITRQPPQTAAGAEPPSRAVTDSRFKSFLDRLRRNPVQAGRGRSRQAAFRIMYDRFREMLTLNDSTLELIADIEDLVGNPRRFSLDAVTRRIRRAAMDVFVMVKDVNQIDNNRHTALYDALGNISNALETEIAPVQEGGADRYVLPLQEIRAIDTHLAGSKMANLGEVGAGCGLAIPDGFSITTGAFLHFMNCGQLWKKCEKLESILELEGSEGFVTACRDVQADIRATPVAEDLAEAILRQFHHQFHDAGTLVAMRSSSIGEDAALSSHAGLYATELNIDCSRLLDAYRAVLASTFSPAAVTYRFQRGITISDSLMAVGCVRMIQPKSSGILYSRLPDNPETDAVLISVVRGISAGIGSGDQVSETLVVASGGVPTNHGSILARDEAAALMKAARRLESHYGRPQDVEWAIDADGIKILQARPMTAIDVKSGAQGAVETDQTPLIEGGFTACPGVGSGPVVLIRTDEDLAKFPQGGVLVARHSKPAYAQVMDRCAAILTDVGSPTGHMSSLAREFQVPTIVGLGSATSFLEAGRQVTVDAVARRVFDDRVPQQPPRQYPRSIAESPASERLRRIARIVTPLTLTDPASPNFNPGSCRSLHDITRYVHEKAFEAMFHYGDIAPTGDIGAVRLEAKLPIRVEIFDVGGGLSPADRPHPCARPEQILSVPMRAFLEGLLEPRIRWDLPRPISVRGFLSVLGESVAGRPTDTGEIGRVSYAIISDRYMNFSTKAGYHFSTIDTYCGNSVNKNYIHFRFVGGAADEERRRRRVRFLSKVVTSLDFSVQVQGDTLAARLDKYGAADIQLRLASLGRLTLCARQLDMLMDNDSSPDIFARAFLAGEWHKF